MIVTRFAPSPTGALHLGHAFSAITAHDLARQTGGRFLVRIEDIDGVRSRPQFVAAILDDLRWLGLGWDGPVVHQSARLAAYHAALETLRERGLVYPCFCTRADIAREIAASTSAPQGAEGEHRYPGSCRSLSAEDRARRLATELHAWRLDMVGAVAMAGTIHWQDAVLGAQPADPLATGDVVLARKDAPASYHLAVTIDDASQGVTDVVRGCDLTAATDIHRLLQALLGLPASRYHHHPMVVDAAGKRLAKRDGAPTLASMRAAGEDGIALADRLRRGELPIGFRLAND